MSHSSRQKRCPSQGLGRERPCWGLGALPWGFSPGALIGQGCRDLCPWLLRQGGQQARLHGDRSELLPGGDVKCRL